VLKGMHATLLAPKPRAPIARPLLSRGRALAAFLVGVLALASGLAILIPNVVVANGPMNINASPYALLSPGQFRPAQNYSSGYSAPAASREKRGSASGQPVCVRLCDGAFFPVTSNAEAACGELCPDAPTALYREPAGSDKIEDAVSSRGALYTVLPVALRYRTTFDPTCTCHRAQKHQYPVMRDATLRKGDYVMTANGVRVFEGERRPPYSDADFVALADSRAPKGQRAALAAMARMTAPLPSLNAETSAITAPRPLTIRARLQNVSAVQHPSPVVAPGTPSR
jgi:hypothetical protein